MDAQKVAAVSKMKSPQKIKALRTISVLDIVQGSERIAEPLYKLLIKKERFFGAKSVTQQLNNKSKHNRKHQFCVIRMPWIPIR